jgi:hypothetical protein
MKGHETLIQMREAGRAPGIVFLNDYPCTTRWAEWGEYATVCTAGDSLSSLDLRFLVGLAVSVSAESEDRAKTLFRLCKQSGAKTVAACHVVPGIGPYKQTGWSDIHHG